MVTKVRGVMIDGIKGADIASAATINLDTADGDFNDVTGTVTITAVTLASGDERKVRLRGALALTHNATSLILPGNANITTADGDVAVFIGLGSSNTQCVSYTKKNGKPVIHGLLRRTFYTAGATWTKQSDVGSVIVKTVGGGAGSGGVAATSASAAASGSGGAAGYSEKRILASALGSTEAVTVGAAGAAGTAGQNNGSAGTASSFGAHLTANGGNGGLGGAAGTASGSTAGGTGGTATGGDLNISGQNGGNSFRISGTQASVSSGGSPAGGYGTGGQGATIGDATLAGGFAGLGYGGGASGVAAAGTQAATAGKGGAPGLVIVEEYA